MRIISGRCKGRKIIAPNNLPVRPTTDQAKESLFNIIYNNFDFEDLEVLDLFSGTGGISYEFLSRGVQNVTAIDAHYNCVAFQKKIKAELSFDNFTPVKNDVFSALKKLNKKFNMIFADPPYALDRILEIPELVFENELLTADGWLIVEHSKDTVFQHPRLIDHRKYGSVNFSIFK